MVDRRLGTPLMTEPVLGMHKALGSVPAPKLQIVSFQYKKKKK